MSKERVSVGRRSRQDGRAALTTLANPIKFGTDGWRGIIAEDFTFDNVRICALAVAQHVEQNGLEERGLVVGYDTRFASEDFAAAVAEVLAGRGIRVRLCVKAAPTPVVSFAVPANNASGGVIITASHNPGSWNGFKIKSQDGASAPADTISRIEENIAAFTRAGAQPGAVERLALDRAVEKGLVEYLDPDPAYLGHLRKLVDFEALRGHSLHVVVDSMYGAGIGYFKALLHDGDVTVTEINAVRNPSFPGIQPEPIARNLTRLSQLVVERKADVGLATDGDADRIGVVDEKGRFLNQHQVFALLCLYLLEVRGERGAIIKTLTSTNMLSRLGEAFGVPVYETAVGFKYVAPLMMEKNALIGGEESGGYGFRGHVPERDAILAGLFFLDFMQKTGMTPSELLQYLYTKVGPHYYDRSDFHISREKREKVLQGLNSRQLATIAGSEVVGLDTTDGFRFVLGDDSWLLIRFSGTEPLVRIYSEAQSPDRVRELLEEGKKLAGL